MGDVERHQGHSLGAAFDQAEIGEFLPCGIEVPVPPAGPI